jgi:hypothetical protein
MSIRPRSLQDPSEGRYGSLQINEDTGLGCDLDHSFNSIPTPSADRTSAIGQ